MSALDPLRRDVAVVALHRARQRHEAVRAVVARRVGHDLGARQIATVLGVIEPILVALENLVPEPER